MPVKLEKNGDTLNVFLIGEIDHHSARDMRECIDTSVEMIKPKRLVLDFGGVSFMDSSGVGLVMGRYKLINFFGGSVQRGCCGMSGRKKENEMRMTMDSKSVNEGFARVSVSAFVAPLDPTVEELQDIKTAVSEAVTNCIVHAYEDSVGKIYITCTVYEGGVVRIKIRDNGCGIENIKQAMMPLYTTKGDERSGLGFAVMESFMDKLRVRSVPQRGTTVVMEKRIHGRELHGQ